MKTWKLSLVKGSRGGFKDEGRGVRSEEASRDENLQQSKEGGRQVPRVKEGGDSEDLEEAGSQRQDSYVCKLVEKK